MPLYHELSAHQRKTLFQSSDEAIFYRTNAGKMADFDSLARYIKVGDPFDIVRANIIIRSLDNKKAIEISYANKLAMGAAGLSIDDFMHSRLSELPYLVHEGQKIFVPIFPVSLNAIYTQDWKKLQVPPYLTILKDFEALTIDPFDYYGPDIYDSGFTKLVAIAKGNKEASFYDYDAECLYFVDAQGRLDAKLALFDEYLPFPQKTHMVQRLRPVAEAYFAGDEERMLSLLVDNRLISGRLIHKATQKDIPEPPKKKEEL
jgi:hypothetical protein